MLWIGRVLTVIPALVKLWEAVHKDDDDAQLEAALGLVREIKDAQMKEALKAQP